MASRLFNLKTSQDQLTSANRGMGELHYIQYAPSRDVTGDNFPNGPQFIKWQTSGQKWWIPRRTYLRMRCTIKRGDNTPITNNDNIAPNLNLFANLFQSIEFRIQNKTICRVSDYVPQVDILDKRLNKSKSWLDNTAAATMYLQPDFQDRQTIISSNGYEESQNGVANSIITVLDSLPSVGTPLRFLDLVTPNQVQIFADGRLLFTANGGTAIPDLSTYFKIGEIIAINDGVERVRRIVSFQTVNTTNDQITVSVAEGNLTAVGAANLVAQIRSISTQTKNSRRIDGLELIWQPPLGIFKVDHAMPGGNYELVLNPQNVNIYQKAAVESIFTDLDTGALATNFSFNVVDMYLFVAQVEGPRADNLSYFLDLDEIKCQKRAIQNTTGLQQEEFSVSPSTSALTLAFQDNRTGSGLTRYSSSKFKIDPNGSELDLKLIRMYLNYAGMNKPQPDANPLYKVGSAEDYTIQRYIDSALYSGTYFTQGGAETIEDWQKRGPYYHFSWPKDATDRSTRVFTNYQFNQAVNNGTVLLFEHYKVAALVKIENGISTQVFTQEM